LDKEPLRIVDYGCAYGYYLSVLKIINPNHDLYGVDCAKEAVESTARIAGNDHAFWARCGEPLPLEDNSVDVIRARISSGISINLVKDFRIIDFMATALLCLVLNKEAAQNLGRPDKAVSPTYFNT